MKIETASILFPKVAEANREALKQLGKKLRESKKQNEWMLCLGAGVSISAKLPNWPKLLARLSAQMLPPRGKRNHAERKLDGAFYDEVEQFYQTFSRDSDFAQKFENALKGKYTGLFEKMNLLEAAEYIRNFLEESMSDSLEDREALRSAINLSINYMIERACRTDVKVEPGKNDLSGSTLAAVARLMKSEKDHLIHNAITYNYDNLLETYLRNICGCDACKVHSIDKKADLRGFVNNDDWNIYHVHGRIPVIPYPSEEMSDSVILTESDYYEEEQINYSWTNIIQSYAMLRSNMIFIGFSGADYNFRRIIKYVNRENGKSEENAMLKEHYIFFSINSIVESVLSEKIKSEKEWEERLEALYRGEKEYAFERLMINYLAFAQTKYWERHGLKVIWSSHEELYQDLESLH